MRKYSEFSAREFDDCRAEDAREGDLESGGAKSSRNADFAGSTRPLWLDLNPQRSLPDNPPSLHQRGSLPLVQLVFTIPGRVQRDTRV
ncbi:MAG: hypothetical protein ACYDBJ_15390 [Aggregatilineales bacterium]